MALAHLAAAVMRARAHQTLDEIRAAGGPSPNTVGPISRFDPARDEAWSVRPSTLNALDRGINGWDEGTAAALYELPEAPPGVMVTDVEQFAELVAVHVVEYLVERTALRLQVNGRRPRPDDAAN